MGELMKEASFSLAEAKFASTGDLNQAVLQNVNKAQIKVKTKNDNVAGVNLPVFESYQDGADSYELAGLAKGGQQLKRMKVGVVLNIASIMKGFKMLLLGKLSEGNQPVGGVGLSADVIHHPGRGDQDHQQESQRH